MLPVLRNRAFTPTFDEPIFGLQRRVNDLFDQFFGGDGGALLQTGSWAASTSMWEDADHIYVEGDMPGVVESDLNLTGHQGSLRIAGERKAPEEARKYWYNERAYGRFERVISLPEAVDPDHIEACLCHGVLKITLTKRPEAKPKRIEVKAQTA